MKIDINKIKIVPKKIKTDSFEVCIFGEPDSNIQEWISFHDLKFYKNKAFTNIVIENSNINDLFNNISQYEWMDGFSPNLCKKFHIGHFSNLVLGKSFKSLGISKKIVSIYGDTIPGDLTKEKSIEILKSYQKEFDYNPDKEFLASEIKYDGDLLKDGDGDYEGTKIFDIDGDKMVGIKSNGNTSYFYQDVALASLLNESTLYLTGHEQNNHFNTLNKLFPKNNHIGLGLVKVGEKMSTRLGNVIFLDDMIESSKKIFNNDIHLVYNVLAGFILKSKPEDDKNINLDTMSNPKNSSGLYLSYTMARLLSAGCEIKEIDNFKSKELQFLLLKSKVNLKPNILFEGLVELCKEINLLYNTLIIKDNKDNKKIFEEKLSDLSFGFKKLGLFNIKKV